ncbi:MULTISPECIES: hypothetical protein [Brevibacterium]|uniref:Activator of Hsp90 ATPase homolog 1-like protein n=1 Tax=Brevibacterium salitolerans TaxID=1403566 RepID=A0ABN2X617_9MICO|nr:hypothetical protein [Brevibacterium sp.]
MAEDTVDASLIEWEDGVDLVLGISVDRTPAQIWPHLTDPRLVDVWFAGFDRDADGPGEGDTLRFTFDDEPVPGELLSVRSPEDDPEEAHILVEIDGIGRLGVTLRGEAGGGADGEETGSVSTRISLAHTIADPDTEPDVIRTVVEQVGPVWETHLRLLAAELAHEAGDASASFDVPEADLMARYADLAAELG